MSRATKEQLWPALVVVAFVGVALAREGSLTGFEHDFDEGGNLMKALLVGDGRHLYAEVWSDQPPLFTWVLAFLLRLGLDVVGARVVVLGCAALSLWLVARLAAREGGAAAAVVAALLLATAPHLLELSTSVMIGLPALTLALLSLEFAAGTTVESPGRFVVVGMLAAAALATKLMVAPLVLAVFALVARRKRREVVAFVVGAGVVSVVVGVAVGAAAFELLLGPHLAARSSGLGLSASALLMPLLPLVIVGGVGTVAAARAPATSTSPSMLMLFAAALVGAVVTVVVVEPHWYHHGLLVSFTAVVPAALALVRSLRSLPLLVLTTTALSALGLFTHQAVSPPPAADVVDRVRASGATMMITDRPMVAVRAGLRVPPSLAVVSLKRAASADLERQFLDVLDGLDGLDGLDAHREHRGESLAVYLGRFELPAVAAQLAEHGAERDVGGGRLWVMKPAGTAPASVERADPLPSP